MKTSTEIESAASIVGEKKAVEYVAKAGFDAWDFSLFDVARYDWRNRKLLQTDHILRTDNAFQYAKELKKIGEDNGIHCNQSHAPFPICCKEIRDSLKKAIECTAIAGGEICVIHPDNNLDVKANTDIYLELLPFAKAHGVKIATENMWNWDLKEDHALVCACSDKKNFCAQMDALKDDFFVACLDIGHAEMKGLNTSAVELIEGLNERLGALHIHDNDLWHDDHQIPFSMKIDFDTIVKALKRVGYKGYFTLEANSYIKNGYTPETVLDGLKDMAKAARKLADAFDALP